MEGIATDTRQGVSALATLRTCAHIARHAHTLGVQATAASVLDALLAYETAPAGALVVLSLAAGLPQSLESANAADGRETPSARVLAVRGIDAREVAEQLEASDVTAVATDEEGAREPLTSWLAYPLSADDSSAPSYPELVLVLTLSEWSPEPGWRAEACAALTIVAEGASAALEAAFAGERAREMEARTRAGADAVKAELLGTVGHELRGPLTAIQGFAATLLRHEQRLARAEQRQFIRDIESASARLSLVIDELLEMAQLAGDAVRLERAQVQPGRIAREAMAAAEARLRTAEGLVPTLRLLIPGASLDALPAVWGDARRLREVFDRVLENAIKYSPEGGQVDVLLRHAHPETVAAARAIGSVEGGRSAAGPLPTAGLPLQATSDADGHPPHGRRVAGGRGGAGPTPRPED
jgi:signal transduction histidine kinase